MKKLLKKNYYQVGRGIVQYLIKCKYFDIIPLVIKLFPKETYRASFHLLKIGYLDLAYRIIKNYLPKNINEIDLKERIEFMQKVRKEGFRTFKFKKKPIKKISVLFAVHNSLPYDYAGYAIKTHQIVSYLKRKNINIIVATRPGYPVDLQKHRNIKMKSSYDVIDDVLYIRLKDREHTFKKGADIKYINLYADELVKIAKDKDITILHGCSNYLNGLAVIQAASILKIPAVYEIRGLWYKTRASLDNIYKKKGMYDYEEIMEKMAAKSADRVVTISYALKDLVEEWGIKKEKIKVIPNAVDTNMFFPIPKNENLIKKYNLKNKIVIGFIGSLTHYEGLRELILAFKKILKIRSDIALLIVGEGREMNKLKKISKNVNNIIFAGRVSPNEVKEYYSVLDICPFPRNNFEVCRYVPPLKILEAMAMKKSIIVSDVPPLLEIIKNNENGLVCQADSIDSLKDKLLYLIDNIEERNRLAANAYNWVIKNRSLDIIGQKYIELYKELKDENSFNFR